MGWLLREPLWGLLSPVCFSVGDAAESMSCSLSSFLPRAGLCPVKCVALAAVSAPRFAESDKTSWH